jgi:hypothetical protein
MKMAKSIKSEMNKWFEYFKNYKQAHTFVIENYSCLLCKAIRQKMIRVGAFILCRKCFVANFKSQDPVIEERDKYLELLLKYNSPEPQSEGE